MANNNKLITLPEILRTHRLYIKLYNELNIPGGDLFAKLVSQYYEIKNRTKEISEEEQLHYFEGFSDVFEDVLRQIQLSIECVKKSSSFSVERNIRLYYDNVDFLFNCYEKEKQALPV